MAINPAQVSLASKLLASEYALMLGSDVIGTNTPRIVFTRKPEERLDVAVDEVASTLGFFGGGLLVDKAFDDLFKGAFRAGGNAAHWARFGKTTGVAGLLFGFQIFVAFLRNYVTTSVNKTSDFNELIDERNTTSLRQQNQSLTPQQEKALTKEKHKAAALGLLSLAAGVALSGAGVVTAKRAIASGKLWSEWNHVSLRGVLRPIVSTAHAIEKRVPWRDKAKDGQSILAEALRTDTFRVADFLDAHFMLGGKQFLKDSSKRTFVDITRPTAFGAWVMSTYLGYLLGARNNIERMEAGAKFTNFVTCFFLLPPLLEQKLMPVIEKAAPQLLKSESSRELTKQLVKLGITTSSLIGTTLGYQAVSRHLLQGREESTPKSLTIQQSSNRRNGAQVATTNTTNPTSMVVQQPILQTMHQQSFQMADTTLYSNPVTRNDWLTYKALPITYTNTAIKVA